MKRFALAGALMIAVFTGVIVAQDKALKELEGTYKVLAIEKSGKSLPADVIDSIKVTIRGDDFSFKIGDDEKKAKIKVDSTKTPYVIDITPGDGPEKGKSFPGIVKLEKGEVTLAFTEKGDRPKEFKSEGETILLKMKKDDKK